MLPQHKPARTWALSLQIPLKKPLYPYQAQMHVDVVLAEPLHSHGVRSLFEIQQTVEIFFNDDVAELDGNRAHKIQFFPIPKLLGDVANTVFQCVVPTNFKARSTTAAMNRIEIDGNWMSVVTEWADNDVRLHGCPVPHFPEIEVAEKLHFHLIHPSPPRTKACIDSRIAHSFQRNISDQSPALQDRLYIKRFRLKSTPNFAICA
jgi:hypothetical protein